MHLLSDLPRRITVLALIGVLILGSGCLAYHNRKEGCGIMVYEGEASSISLLNQFRPRSCVFLERADTTDSRELGLSGRVSMKKTNGMLFVFDRPQQVCIWMKDMNFSLDIVWLNTNKTIIKAMSNILPETYPKTFCVDNAQYVGELKAGVAEEAGLRLGQQLKI